METGVYVRKKTRTVRQQMILQ